MYNTRQAEAMIDEEFLDIFLWCNMEVEGNLRRCNARVTIISLGVNGASDAIRKQVTKFHTSNRFMTSTILRNELSMSDILIRLELYDIFGYRDFVMFTIDFTKPSPLTDLNVGFQNSDVRVYVNTQYLSIHSAKFAHLFVRIKPGCAERLCPTTENKSEFGTCSDYDVLSMQSDEAEVKLYSGEEIFGARTHDVDNMCFLLPIWFQFLLHRQKTRGLLGLPAEIGEASVQQGYELDRNRCFYQQTSSATAYATAQGVRLISTKQNDEVNLFGYLTRHPDAKGNKNELSVNNPEDYFQGDVDLSEQQVKQIEKSLLEKHREKRKVGRAPIYKIWDRTHPISFDFAETVPRRTRAKIREAMNLWQRNTCIRFEENGPSVDRLEFFDGGGCSSFVGRIGGTQSLQILVTIGVTEAIYERLVFL
ncbi:hypothetical protein RB195_025319 [Necator americanus]|uniref:Peptidase M12A domain-containing protein n=1 Tax=Necator americanus TaxID=51031 RepID=A0ABR1EU16_NECAM